jgi:hypothetical protein
MKNEILIYALPAGESRDYMEDLISSHCKNIKDVEKVKAAASRDGWHSFRVISFTPGTVPDFYKLVN